LLALQKVSAVTLIVMRNLTTLAVAFFEYIFLGTKMSALTVSTLLGILAGAVLYGFHDLGFSVQGFAWLMANVLFTTAFQIYIKHLISSLPEDGPGALGPFGMSYYNNMISLPILVLVSAASNEYALFPEILKTLSRTNVFVVTLSGALGFVLSTSAFLLNKLVTATSMMVANNVNKFAAILLSELFIEQTLGMMSGFGTCMVLAFGWLYAESKGTYSDGALARNCSKLGTSRMMICPALISVFIPVFLMSRYDKTVVDPSKFLMANRTDAILVKFNPIFDVKEYFLPPITFAYAEGVYALRLSACINCGEDFFPLG
jgi:drug/metabolite transporter (DMT)-like permease